MIFGVCLGSGTLRIALYSGVNCSSWPAQAGGTARTAAAAAMAHTAVHRMVLMAPASLSRRSRVAQPLLDGIQQLSRAVRLGEVGRGASVHRLLVVAAERERGDDDDGDLGGLGLGPDLPGRIEARQLGQLDVHDDQDLLLAHTASVACAIRRGIAKRNVEPRPGSLSTQMRPPWSSTKVLVMLNPRPVPPNSRLMLESTWRNSPKMWSSWSLGMPMPVSATL